MKTAPVTIKSTFLYQILLFVVLQVWIVMIFEAAQFQLVTLYDAPLEWIGWASLVFLTLVPILSLLAWKLKDRINLGSFDWDFRTREIDFQEFTKIVEAYYKSYRHMISTFDFRLLLFALASFLGALTLPFPLMRTGPLIIQFTPFIIAVLLLLFGLFFTYLIFKLLPNSVTNEFPAHRPKTLQAAVIFLSHLPGVYWSGVRVTIGESGGFYTLRDPCAVARIEGIEGVARIECYVDDDSTITHAISLLESEGSRVVSIGRVDAPVTATDIVLLIRKTLESYIVLRGNQDVLDDILDEINEFIAKYATEQSNKISNDGLISSDDNDAKKEERT